MRYLLSAACLLCSLHGFPQLFSPPSYPHDYFRDPLSIPMSLAANFGELRPNHYHMGLDIRTQHRENLPVYAAADGYVSRVSVEPAGFGQAIYITHPNGYTTVYGHLNQFFPALAAYIHQEQYRRQSWQVYLEIPPALFTVKKGDFIAFSGNTGGSQGPHLHFEIRRTAGDTNLNPLLFGLPVPDNTAPGILRLAWYDRNQGIYEQSPHLLPVRKEGGAWTITPALLTVPTNRLSFALSAFDTQSGSANPNGIFEADLYEDDRPVIGFQMDRISYNNTRNINAHIDYKTREKGGPFLQHLSFFSGYPFPSIYSAATGGSAGEFVDPAAPAAAGVHPATGVLDIGDGRPHRIRIEVKDTYGNTSVLQYTVVYRPSASVPAAAVLPGGAAANTAGSAGGAAANTAGSAGGAAANTPGSGNTAASAYTGRRADTIDGATPASVASPGKVFYPGMVDGLELSNCAFYLGEKSLYDSAILTVVASGYPGSGHSLPGGISHTYSIGAPWIPLLEPVLVRIKDERVLDTDSLLASTWKPPTDKIVMVCYSGSQKDVERVEWHDGWASARFREFGNYQLVDDRTPPVITALGFFNGANLSKTSSIAISVKDDLGAVRGFRAELDGAWLCFTNDKGLAFLYTFDEHCPPGAHTLKVSVEDVAGNKSTKEFHFTR